MIYCSSPHDNYAPIRAHIHVTKCPEWMLKNLNQVGDTRSLSMISILLGSWIGEYESSSLNKPSFFPGSDLHAKGGSWKPPKLFFLQSRWVVCHGTVVDGPQKDMEGKRGSTRLLVLLVYLHYTEKWKTKTGVKKNESSKQLKFHL